MATPAHMKSKAQQETAEVPVSSTTPATELLPVVGASSSAGGLSAADEDVSSRKGKTALKLIAALLVASYVAGAVFFAGHFMPRTFAVEPGSSTQDSPSYRSLAFSSIKGFEDELTSNCSNFSTTLTKGEYALSVKGSEVDLAPNDSDLITKMEELKGNFLAWPLELFQERRLSELPTAAYNEDSLSKLVDASVATWNETAEAPGPPSVVYNEDTKKFEAVHGAYGTQLEAEEVRKVAAAKLENALTTVPASEDMSSVDESTSTSAEGAASGTTAVSASDEDTGAEQQPKVEQQPEGASKEDMESTAPASEMDDTVLTPPETEADISHLEEVAAQGNKMLDLSIPIYVNGEEGYRIQRHEILSWLVLDNNEFSLDTHRIGVWVDDILSPAINYTDDKYEWHTWRDLNTETIAKAVTNLSEEPIEAQMFTMLRVPDETPGAKERGRHIDVNINTQYARMYNDKGEIIWETFIVTGEADGTHETPTGTFQIQAKETNRVLIGLDEDNDGEPDYRTPVTYWMPFSGGYGLHDATWRSSFGGDIYSYGGSHGCVNLPYAKAESLFNIVNVGDTVYIHS